MNVVHLIGRLATDVAVNGDGVSSCIIGVDRSDEETDYFRIKWIGPEVLCKGRKIAVEGQLRQDSYEKDGEERRAVSIRANRIELL